MLQKWLDVAAPVNVKVARSLLDSGVFITHPKWDKNPSLFSCEYRYNYTVQPTKHVLSCPLIRKTEYLVTVV